MQTAGYEIKLAQFEGPFDLLLFFIERDELNIHDIPISKITDDFLNYVQQMQSLNIELASEFIFVASTLMRIKAKMLLPRFEIDDPENEIDLKKELTRKLILYKQFKNVCEELRILAEKRMSLHARGNIKKDNKNARVTDSTEEELSSFNLYNLLILYENLMFNFTHQIQEVTHTVAQPPYTIEQQKESITQLIELNKKLDFRQIMKASENKIQIVFNFLAILEMLQESLLEIEIGLGFNNFFIAKKEPTRYEASHVA